MSTPEGVHTDANPAKPTKPVERPPSSCPAGTKLQGLNYFKNKPDLVALEDSEYPEWLWSLLDDAKKQAKSEGGVDPSSMSLSLLCSWCRVWRCANRMSSQP